MELQNTRTHNAIVNSLYGIVAAILSVIINFAVRIVLVRALGEEINGLHNLFQNTINVLALMEAGISTAMVIHLYKPIKEENHVLICQLIGFYKRIYLCIAFGFLLLGVIVAVFFLDSIVTSTIPMMTVRFYFILFALSFFINYLTYYKRSILFAEQKNRISIAATIGSEVVFRGLAIVFAIVYHQYYLFLILLIIERFFGNYICIQYVNKHHPYLQDYIGEPLAKSIKQSIWNTIKPLFINQTASTVQKSANSILIGMLLGNISIVGYYGSYQLVSGTVELLFSQFGGAFTSGFGNLSTEGNTTHMFAVYKKTCIIVYTLAFVCCAAFLSCIQLFIGTVFGSNFILDMSTVVILLLSMFITLFNIPIVSVQNAVGLHRLDASWMIVQAFIAIILGYYCGKLFGMNGILLGLIIPTFVFTSINKGVLIFKHVFKLGRSIYLSTMFITILRAIIVIFVSYLAAESVNVNNVWCTIILKAVVSAIVSVMATAIVYIPCKDFRGLAEKILIRQ